MPSNVSSPRTLDLFDYTITVPTPLGEPAVASVKQAALASLSDAELTQQLGQFVEEVQRRLRKGRGIRPELEEAANQASLSLKHLIPSPKRQNKPSKFCKASSVLQEGQRKAVRAALLAGVAPSQVAKHFRLSQATVRKMLEETT